VPKREGSQGFSASCRFLVCIPEPRHRIWDCRKAAGSRGARGCGAGASRPGAGAGGGSVVLRASLTGDLPKMLLVSSLLEFVPEEAKWLFRGKKCARANKKKTAEKASFAPCLRSVLSPAAGAGVRWFPIASRAPRAPRRPTLCWGDRAAGRGSAPAPQGYQCSVPHPDVHTDTPGQAAPCCSSPSRCRFPHPGGIWDADREQKEKNPAGPWHLPGAERVSPGNFDDFCSRVARRGRQ